FTQSEGALQQAVRDAQRRAVPSQPFLDLARALAAVRQVDGGLGDAGVGAHEAPSSAAARTVVAARTAAAARGRPAAACVTRAGRRRGRAGGGGGGGLA